MDEEKNEPEAQEPTAEAEEPAAEPEAAAEPEVEAEAEPETGDEDETSPEEPEVEEPVADAEAPAEAAAETPAAPAAPAAPRKSRADRKANAEKRAAAKARARAGASKPGERKPIVREPKPERDRGKQKERRGVVVSSAMDKTIVVRVDATRPHPAYKKVVRRSKKFHAHDEQNAANVGDLVRIVETRPLSKTKSWRLVEILEAAK